MILLLLSGLALWYTDTLPWSLRFLRYAGDTDSRQRGHDHHRPVSDSRVHEHDHGRGQLRLHGSWHRDACLGLDIPPQMVRQGQERAATHQVTPPPWDRRVHRANELASAYPFAAEGLRFYARVAEFQRNLYSEIGRRRANSPAISSELSQREELDIAFLRPQFSQFLSMVGQIAPRPLAEASARMAYAEPAVPDQVLQDFWRDEGSDSGREAHSEFLLAWTFLQPWAEYLANRLSPPGLDGAPSFCPLCGSKPIVGVLRPEGDGAKKSLICMLCAHEWAFRRLLLSRMRRRARAATGPLFLARNRARTRRRLRHLPHLREKCGSDENRNRGPCRRRARGHSPGPLGARTRLREASE